MEFSLQHDPALYSLTALNEKWVGLTADRQVRHRSGVTYDSPLVLLSSILHLTEQLVQSTSCHCGHAHHLQAQRQREVHLANTTPTAGLNWPTP